MIFLAGGKTGGHIMPLLSVAKQLEDVCYIGSQNSLEERLCMEHHIPFIGMKLRKRSILSILSCTFHLHLEKPTGILSTGGYVSFPVLLYGILHRIPIYLLEENVIIGKTNHFFEKFAKKVFLAFPVKKMKKKYEVVGIPNLANSLQIEKYSHFSFDVLIIGGSLGSKPLCDLVHSLKNQYRVCLIASRYFEEYKNLKNVQVFSYVPDLPNLMLHSKVLISRAGASTTYEIFSIGKPCIVIPSQNTSQNHQYLNALFFEEKGCAKLVRESEAQDQVVSIVRYLMENHEAREKMIQNQKKLVQVHSCEKIIEEIVRK